MQANIQKYGSKFRKKMSSDTLANPFPLVLVAFGDESLWVVDKVLHSIIVNEYSIKNQAGSKKFHPIMTR